MSIALPIIDTIAGIIGKVITSKSEKDAAIAQLNLMVKTGELQKMLAQIELNKEEAKHASIFVSGARPFVMWTCAFALAYASILEPFIRFIATVLCGYAGTFPVIDTTITMQVLFGILGLGGYRAMEKIKGVARS